MKKLRIKYLLILSVMTLNFLILHCARRREENSCRKAVQLRVFQTCVNERQNTNGSQTEYADQLCFISLLEYAQCSDR